MIQFNQITKKYGDDVVLDLPELSIPKGEKFGLVGNNGAGKTTAFSLILNLIEATTGAVLSKEYNVRNSEQWKKYTSAFLDESFLIDFLTPDEYFSFIGDLYHWNENDVANFLTPFEEFFNGEIIGVKKYIRDLSKGNQKKVGLVSAFIGDPEIIILDEPFSNLDPTSQIRLIQLISQFTLEKTVLISSHDLKHIAEVCQRIVILERGKIVEDIQKSEQTLRDLESYFTV